MILPHITLQLSSDVAFQWSGGQRLGNSIEVKTEPLGVRGMVLLDIDAGLQGHNAHAEVAPAVIPSRLPHCANDTPFGPVVMVADDETELTDELCDYLGRYGRLDCTTNSKPGT